MAEYPKRPADQFVPKDNPEQDDIFVFWDRITKKMARTSIMQFIVWLKSQLNYADVLHSHDLGDVNNLTDTLAGHDADISQLRLEMQELAELLNKPPAKPTNVDWLNEPTVTLDGTLIIVGADGSATWYGTTVNYPEITLMAASLPTGSQIRIDVVYATQNGSYYLQSGVNSTSATRPAIPANTLWTRDIVWTAAGGNSSSPKPFKVDDALSATSTNPVQNKVVTTALNLKEPAFTKNTGFNKNFGTTSGTVSEGNHLHTGVYEPAFTKNTGFNKNFGTTAGTVSEGSHLHAGVYEPAFTKNTGFNKNFGTTAGTVSEGSHLHTGVYEPAFTKNTGFNKNFGTTAGTVAEGDHTHTAFSTPNPLIGIHRLAGNYTLLDGITHIFTGTHDSVGWTLTLPDPSLHNGRAVQVRNGGWGAILFATPIYNAHSKVNNTDIPAGYNSLIYSDGTQWNLLHKNSFVQLQSSGAGVRMDADAGREAQSGNSTLYVKSLIAGTGVTLTSDATTVTINATGGGGGGAPDTIQVTQTAADLNLSSLVISGNAHTFVWDIGSGGTLTFPTLSNNWGKTLHVINRFGVALLLSPTVSRYSNGIRPFQSVSFYASQTLNRWEPIRETYQEEGLKTQAFSTTNAITVSSSMNYRPVIAHYYGAVNNTFSLPVSDISFGSYAVISNDSDYTLTWNGVANKCWTNGAKNVAFTVIPARTSYKFICTGAEWIAVKLGNLTASGGSGDLTKAQADTYYAAIGHDHAGIYEPSFAKNSGFNKNLGTAAGTVAEGNHLHAGVYEPAFTKNTGFNKNFGSTAGTVAEGNHTHAGVGPIATVALTDAATTNMDLALSCNFKWAISAGNKTLVPIGTAFVDGTNWTVKITGVAGQTLFFGPTAGYTHYLAGYNVTQTGVILPTTGRVVLSGHRFETEIYWILTTF